jgi:hypothetical protein
MSRYTFVTKENSVKNELVNMYINEGNRQL